MKYTAIISLSALFLTACTTTNYQQVSTESYSEVYKTETVTPVGPSNNNTTSNEDPQAAVQQNEAVSPEEMPADDIVVIGACDDKSNATAKKSEVEDLPDFNSYVLQVMSVQEKNKIIGIEQYAKQLPSELPKWKQNKTIDGEAWSTLLVGEFSSSDNAKAAIESFPESLSTVKPFAISVKSIQCSPNSSLIKL